MFTINTTTTTTTTIVVFSKFFGEEDKAAVLAVVEGARRVLFVDTASTPVLVETVSALVKAGVEVILRDHHRGEGRNPEAAEAVEAVLGENARIVTRSEAPGCAMLVQPGEFAGDVIVADPDLDGLSAAMKAAGVVYEGQEADAAVFDVRPMQSAETLTALGWTAVRSLSTLPPFDRERPQVSENAKGELFALVLKAAQGDQVARDSLESRVTVYEAGVAEARRLLAECLYEPLPGVVLVDTVGADKNDLNTLSRGMEDRGAKVTVVRKNFGPIAKEHGVQLSLAVPRPLQRELDLRTLVPEGAETSPVAGLLSNTSFLLHCSEAVWAAVILPALKEKLGV